MCITLSDFIAIIQVIITFGVGIATIVVYFRITHLANKNNDSLNDRMIRNNRFQKLNSDLDRIVDYTIKYPYFDDIEYKKHYLKYLKSSVEKEKEMAIRYEAFAIMNFNFIEDLYLFFDGDESKMSDLCDYKEIVIDNKYYWRNMVQRNEDGYFKIFEFVTKLIQKDDDR
jgi:cell division protein FtsI/penicillin-binding protein 2